MTLDLQYISPNLEKLENLALAVPGTYIAGQKNSITIRKFASKLSVISSKQRPRRLTIRGSDGRDYDFLLKGNFLDTARSIIVDTAHKVTRIYDKTKE